jgi:hypothetical protein
MSYFSDVFRLRKSKGIILLGCALLVAAFAVAILRYEQDYDAPPVTSIPKTKHINLLGRDAKVTITCQCPPYLVVQQSRDVRFDGFIQIEALAGPTPSPRPIPKPPNPDSRFSAATAITGSASEPRSLSLYGGANPAQGFSYNPGFFALEADLLSKLSASKTVLWNFDPPGAEPYDVTVSLSHIRPSGEWVEDLANFDFSLPVRRPFSQVMKPVLYAVIIFVATLVLFYSLERKYRLIREHEEQRLQAAQARVQANPDKASPTWELAGANLEKYFARNLSQVRQVFYVAVGVMLAGFSFVLYAIYAQVTWQASWLAQHPNVAPTITPPTWIASISGLITQFIGATFMVIYRSTMAQANEFVTVLNRTNTVGIAMKVLDQIPDTETTKNSSREQLISLLLTQGVKSPAPALGTGKKSHDGFQVVGEAPVPR